MARTTAPTEADLLFNRSAIASAKSERILQALLGPRKAEDTAATKTVEEEEEEEAELFKPESESTGPGFDSEASVSALDRRTLRADEKLRTQLLGKGAKRAVSGYAGQSGKHTKSNVPSGPPSQSRPINFNRNAESDEDEGRSSLGKTKRHHSEHTSMIEAQSAELDGQSAIAVAAISTKLSPPLRAEKKRPVSYLDEVLSARSKKKKRKMGTLQPAETTDA